MEYYVVRGNGVKTQFKVKPEEEEIIERFLKFLCLQGIITDWALTMMETI